MGRFGNLARRSWRWKPREAQRGQLVNEKVSTSFKQRLSNQRWMMRACRRSWKGPNWDTNLRICSMINREELWDCEVVRTVKISGDGSPLSQRLILNLLEPCTVTHHLFEEGVGPCMIMMNNSRTDRTIETRPCS